jgi:2-(1,2-epoxy-1,2-dihydrophenyl)acetyl-CoA isomerase
VPGGVLIRDLVSLAGWLLLVVALRYMKRNMNAAETASLKEMLDLEAWHHTRTGMTEDHREAARAFVDKREPHFKGR